MMTYREERRRQSDGFTRLDLGMVAAMVCLLGVVGIPLIARAGINPSGAACIENLRRLTLAWSLYAADSHGKVVNNFSITDTLATVSAKTYLTWTHNILDWTTSPSNTNGALVAASKLFAYAQNDPTVFKCPADNFLSAAQQRAGWQRRVRSYSMNAFMGPYNQSTNNVSYRGENPFYPGYRQFLLRSSIPRPRDTIVFLDEHPDSVNDGYFINNPVNTSQWGDLPASYHDGAAGFSFADGSAELHAWQYASTKVPVRFNFTGGNIPSSERGDYLWLAQRVTVAPTTLAITLSPTNQLQITWSAFPTNYVLQTSPSLTDGAWTNVPTVPVRGSGQSAVTTEAPTQQGFFRLLRP